MIRSLGEPFLAERSLAMSFFAFTMSGLSGFGTQLKAFFSLKKGPTIIRTLSLALDQTGSYPKLLTMAGNSEVSKSLATPWADNLIGLSLDIIYMIIPSKGG